MIRHVELAVCRGEEQALWQHDPRAFVWLNVHCRANERQPLARALIVLFFELVKRKEGR